MRVVSIFVFLLIALGFSSIRAPAPLGAEREFARFAVSLPEGWDGDEQTGFVTDNPAEYLLTIARPSEDKSGFTAQISVFMLPNKEGLDAREAARRLAEAQGEAEEPTKDGEFWVFEGEPRTRALKGRAKTRVNAGAKTMLIIVSQDPENLGAEEIARSLRGLTPDARELLGH